MKDIEAIKEKKNSFSKVLDIIIDVFVIPVLLLAIISTGLMYSAKQRNEVPSLFGYSALVILTGSMADETTNTFMEGSYVMVKAIDPKKLEINDIIAFYEYDQSADPENEPPQSNPQVSGMTLGTFLGDTNPSQAEAAQNGSRVIFHRVFDILDVNGTIWVQTKGDNNGTPDEYVRQDFIVGKYVDSALGYTFANIFQFCASPLGISLLVIVPSGAMLYLLAQSFINQLSSISEDKKLRQREKAVASGITIAPKTKTPREYIGSNEKQNTKIMDAGQIETTSLNSHETQNNTNNDLTVNKENNQKPISKPAVPTKPNIAPKPAAPIKPNVPQKPVVPPKKPN